MGCFACASSSSRSPSKLRNVYKGITPLRVEDRTIYTYKWAKIRTLQSHSTSHSRVFDSTPQTSCAGALFDVPPHFDDDQHTPAQKKSKFQETSFPVFPAGEHSYSAINSDPRAFYIDKTRFIPYLEAIGVAVILLAPRRFGKSLLLDTLACYYDISREEMFEKDFGRRWIGQVDEFEQNGTKTTKPRKTELANKFYVLRLDFSGISADSLEQLNESLNDIINTALVLFCDRYPDTGIDLRKEGSFLELISENAIRTLVFVYNFLLVKNKKLMILIDEYDALLNSVIGNNEFARDPRELKKMENRFKSFFSHIKSRLGPNLRVFIAGVTPMVLSTYTSGFNVGYNNLQDDMCPNLFGFTESDVDAGLKLLSLDPDAHHEVFSLMKELHNGYRFHPTSPDTLFNPTRVQFVLSKVSKFLQANPKSSIANLKKEISAANDPNSKPAEAVLRLVSSNPNTFNIVTDCLSHPNGISSSMTEMIYQLDTSSMIVVEEQSFDSVIAWMFFNGALTYAKQNEEDYTLSFVVPNQVARKEFIDEFLKFGPPDARSKLQTALSALLDSAEPSIDPFLRGIESSVLGGTEGRNVFDNEGALQSLLYTSFLLCARSGDTVESEHVTKPFHANSKDSKAVDLLYQSLSGGKKRFALELKSAPVSKWAKFYGKNQISLSKMAESAQDAMTIAEKDLLKLKWYPLQNRPPMSIQNTLDEAIAQLKDYLADMTKEATEGPVIGFAIVRVGLYRLIYRKVTT